MLRFWRGRSVSQKGMRACVGMRTLDQLPEKKGSNGHRVRIIHGHHWWGYRERQLIHVCQSLLKSGNTHQSLQLALDGEPAAPGMGICGGVMDLALWVIPAGTDLFAQSAAWHAQETGDLGPERREVSFPVQGILCRWVDLSSAADPASFWRGSLWSSVGSNHTHHGLALGRD